jgi:hypothetical protein
MIATSAPSQNWKENKKTPVKPLPKTYLFKVFPRCLSLPLFHGVCLSLWGEGGGAENFKQSLRKRKGKFSPSSTC